MIDVYVQYELNVKQTLSSMTWEIDDFIERERKNRVFIVGRGVKKEYIENQINLFNARAFYV